MSGAPGRADAMRRPTTLALVTTAVLLVLIVPAAAQAQSVPTTASAAGSPTSHGLSAVFTMTDNATANSVLAYRIGAGGALVAYGSFPTHGAGFGSSLADQGALALTSDHQWLLVVDAGSNQVSVFHVNAAGLSLPLLSYSDRIGSGGILPVSIAIHGSLVYVLNAGNTTVAGNIAGFTLSGTGRLAPLAGSDRWLSTANSTGPAQISFNPAGTVLVVSEKATSLLDTYTVATSGYASGPVSTPSNGSTPYGFAFSPNGHLVVSDAGPGALSSYAISITGALTVISGTSLDNQSAPCWVAFAEGGRYAYTTNAHSNSVSTYQVAQNGSLLLQASIGATTGVSPTDLAVTSGSHYLLTYDAGAGEIDEYSLGASGSLTEITSVYGLPSTAEGLVAF
jgi:6-phosphogluconolactonase